jgi:hypothetical protein
MPEIRKRLLAFLAEIGYDTQCIGIFYSSGADK